MTQENGISLKLEEDQLSAVVAEIINIYDKRRKLDKKTRRWMTFCLTHFVHDAIKKFVQGQKEHGGDFKDDCVHIHEAMKEVTDLFWYLNGKRYNKL